ncbi:MAG TPA: MarR family winged helix-turn-helix transcriptional regulator [Kofleriaceae bacterium]
MRRAFSSLAANAYSELGIGATQAKFVRHIGLAGTISQAELARMTNTDPTLTGRILSTLIERCWVKRERSEEDRREYVVELAPPAKRMQAKIEATREELAAKVVAALDDRDIEDFERIAKKIVAAFSP